MGKSELPESFRGRRGRLSSPVNKPGLATDSPFWDEGHMRVISFPRTQGGCGSWAWPTRRWHLTEAGGKKSSLVSPLLPRGPAVTGSFVWSVGGYPGRFPGRSWYKKLFSVMVTLITILTPYAAGVQG